MKWINIFIFSLFGIVMGSASLFGLTQGIELPLWIVIALIVAVLITRATTHKVFLHGILAGIGMAVLNVLVQIIFFSLYVHNNPNAASQLEHFTELITPQWFLLISSPFIGTVYGSLIGGLSVAASKFHHPK